MSQPSVRRPPEPAARRVPGAPRVFVSYAHGSPEHCAAVRRLGELLRDAGVDVRLDQFADGQVSDWPRWAEREVRAADTILMVVSPDYRRADDEQEPDGTGRGVIWELAAIRELVYSDRRRQRGRLLPVVLPGATAEDIPFFLGPAGGHRLVVPEVTAAGIGGLLRALTGRPGSPPDPRPGPRPGHLVRPGTPFAALVALLAIDVVGVGTAAELVAGRLSAVLSSAVALLCALVAVTSGRSCRWWPAAVLVAAWLVLAVALVGPTPPGG